MIYLEFNARVVSAINGRLANAVNRPSSFVVQNTKERTF
jgi:hypothetical protein